MPHARPTERPINAQPQRAGDAPLPIGIHCAMLPVYAALHLCGDGQPLSLWDFVSPPAPKNPARKGIKMASAVSAGEPGND